MLTRTEAPQPAARRAVLYGLFGISGLTSLGYQLAWTRMLSLGLGHEMPAILAVVAAFFGGLALGSWVMDRPVAASPRPGHWYAVLEGVIGLWAGLTVFLLPWANDFTSHLMGLYPSQIRHWTLSFSAPFLILLPCTMAMGATLPAMERWLAAQSGEESRLGGLYAVNVGGAMAGTLLSTFLLVPALGYSKTVALLAAINLACGGAAWKIASGTRLTSAKPAPPSQTPIPGKRLYATVFTTGLLGIGFEILGIRVLSEVLENTVYSFAAVLSVFLLGTSLGAGAYQKLIRHQSFHAVATTILASLSVCCLIGIWALTTAQTAYAVLRETLGDSLPGVLAAELVVASMVFFLPTLFMGAAFSHFVRAAKGPEGGIGKAAALNTLGGALAPVLFGVLLLPAAGAKGSLVLTSLAYLLLIPRLTWKSGLALILPFGISLGLPSRIQQVQAPPGGEILEYRQGVLGSVSVLKHFDGHRSLQVNNRFTMGGTGAASAAQRHFHIPLLLHPEPKRALFLGLGTGISFAAAAPHPGLAAEGVELVPEIVRVSNHFEPENRLREGLRVHVADARRFVRAATNVYDVVVADLFHPARDGAGSLYTLEHFQAIRERLATGGIFCQWLPLYQMDEPVIKIICRTFLEVFPQTRAFLLRYNVDTPVLGLIAQMESSRYPADWLGRRAQAADLRKALKSLALDNDFQLFGLYLANSVALRNFSLNAALNKDDRPIVQFEAPRFGYQRQANSHGRLMALLDQVRPNPNDLILPAEKDEELSFVSKLQDFYRARDLYLSGLVSENEGDQPKAMEQFLASARASTDFTTAYAHCLTLAFQEFKSDPTKARQILEQLAAAQPSRNTAQEFLDRLFKE